MPYGDGGIFSLGLHNCKKWRSIDDLIQPLNAMMAEFRFRVFVLPSLTLLSFEDAKQEFPEYCHLHYEVREGKWDKNYYSVHADGGLTLRFEIPFFQSTSQPLRDHMLMSSSIFGEEYNKIVFSSTLGTRHLDSERINKYQGLLMNLYSQISLFLIPFLSPDYVSILEDDEKNDEFVQANQVLQKQVKYIYWANYFGSEYLSKGEQKIFNAAPAGKVNSFGDGLWYYLHEDFEALTDEEMFSTERIAMDYFSQYFDLKWVQWRFSPA